MANCCRCQEPAPVVCRTQITSADLAELIYVAGLDANLCDKFTPLANLLQLRDCAGNILGFNSQVVLCSQFAANLCTALTLLDANGPVVFGTTQLVGVDCKTYVVNETPITVNDTACIDLSAGGLFGHTLTATLQISADPENVAECRPDGVYVPSACFQIQSFPAGTPVVLGVTPMLGKDCLTHVIPETPLTVIDTPCFNFDISGSFGHTLTGNVILSPAAGNGLTCLPDGLYSSPTVLQVADTSCIDMTISGPAGAQTISANPVLSVDAGNDLTCHPNGLFVSICAKLAASAPIGPATPGVTFLMGRDCNAYTIPAPAPETPITVIDTFCINLTSSGTAGHTLQANLTLDPSPENIAVCTPAGLLVDVDIFAQDTNCFDMSVTEGPAGNFTISGDVKISPVAGNGLSCTAQGLYVSTAIPGGTTIVGQDTPCAHTAVVEGPPTVFTVGVEPIINPTAPGFPLGCQGIECTVDGLSVDPPNPAAFDISPTGTPIVNHIPMTTGQTVNSAVHTVTITNPSACRSAVVDAIISMPALEVATTPENAQLRQSVNWSSSFPSNVQALTLLTQRTLNTFLAPAYGADSEQVNVHVRFMIAPGETGTITAQETVTMVAGNSPDVLAQDTFINILITTL